MSPEEPSQRSPLDSSSKQDTTNEVLKDSTDAEITKIRLMRAFVEARDPSSKVPTCTKPFRTAQVATFSCNCHGFMKVVLHFPYHYCGSYA